MLENPTQKLNNLSADVHYVKSTIKNILNENKIRYFKKTPFVGLNDQHKIARVTMCNMISTYQYQYLPPIIFTDESTIRENLMGG